MNKKFFRSFIGLICFALLFLTAACYQRFDKIDVKASGKMIIFSHPKITKAFEQGNIVVLHSFHVYRKAPEGDEREMWYVANRRDGTEYFSAALSKPFVAYAENLPAMSVLIDPKPIREGHYTINAEFGIYNQKRERLDGLTILDDFDLTADDAGNLSVK